MPSKELIPEHRDICISENITDIRVSVINIICIIMDSSTKNCIYL